MSNILPSGSSTPAGIPTAANGTASTDTRNEEVDLLVVKKKEIETLLADIKTFGGKLERTKRVVERAWAHFEKVLTKEALKNLDDVMVDARVMVRDAKAGNFSEGSFEPSEMKTNTLKNSRVLQAAKIAELNTGHTGTGKLS